MAQGVWIHRVRATDAAEDEVVRRVREAMLAETRGEAVDELRALEAELDAFERTHGMSSRVMAEQVTAGTLVDTPERCRWLTRWRLLQHLRRAAAT